MEEFIICSAIHYNDGIVHKSTPKNIDTGIVICGRRHFNCVAIFEDMAIVTDGMINRTEMKGFLTNTNRFVGRHEAYLIAFLANQIIGPE
jgi:hypothetical protein